MTGKDYRALRIGHGLTQLQLANLLGVAPSTIARREASEELPAEQEIAIRAVCEEGSLTPESAGSEG